MTATATAPVKIQVPTQQAPAQAKALVTASMASPSPRGGGGGGTGFGVGGRVVIPGGSMVSAGRYLQPEVLPLPDLKDCESSFVVGQEKKERFGYDTAAPPRPFEPRLLFAVITGSRTEMRF